MPKKPSKSAHPLKKARRRASKSAAGKAAPPKNTRGREDRVYRLRAQVWLGAIWVRCPVDTLTGLDHFFLGDDGPARTFWRIARDATDPGLAKKSLNRQRLIDVVAAKSGFFHTRGLYDSELWTEVLGPTPLSPQRRDELITIVLERLGLFEPSPEDRWIGTELDLGIAALKPGTFPDFQRWLHWFARRRHIDHILLLCLLYRRAIEASALEEAIALRDALLYAIRRFCDRPGFSGDLSALWLYIVRRRVLAGQRSLEHSPEALAMARELLADWGKRCRSDAHRARHEERVWMMACAMDNHSEPIPGGFHALTREIETFLASKAELRERARRRALARQLWRYRRESKDGVTASTRFAEMRGHREPWRPGDY